MTFDSNQRFQNSLNSKLAELREALDDFERVLALSNRIKKVEQANVAMAKLLALSEMLAPADTPIGVPNLMRALQKFASGEENAENSSNIIKMLVKSRPQIAAHNWDYLKEENKFPVAEVIANQAYMESKLPNLFETLATQLEAVIESGSIDSNSAIKRLKELIKLIRKNANASFYSASYMITFGVCALRNIVKEVGVQYFGPFGKAIQDTVKEMDEEWPELNQQIHEKVTAAYRASMPSVDLLPAPFDPLESKELVEVLLIEPLRIEDMRPGADVG